MKSIFQWGSTHRIRIRGGFLLGILAGLGGCASFDGYPQRATDPAKDLAELAPLIGVPALSACSKVTTTECRAQIVSARMYAIDIQFSAFEEKLFRDTRSAGFAATVGSLGLTTAAAASGPGTARALSGVSAFLIGSRESFQKEVLAERTIIAIHTAMRSRRAQVALRLRLGLTQPTTQYPLASALLDLNDYYEAGTVLGALVGITASVGASAQRAEAELTETFSFKLDTGGAKLRDFVCGGDFECAKPDVTKFAAIQACWPKAGVPANTPMLTFIFDAGFASQRAQVGNCVKP